MAVINDTQQQRVYRVRLSFLVDIDSDGLPPGESAELREIMAGRIREFIVDSEPSEIAEHCIDAVELADNGAPR